MLHPGTHWKTDRKTFSLALHIASAENSEVEPTGEHTVNQAVDRVRGKSAVHFRETILPIEIICVTSCE